jgi:hypothetical protein
VTSKSAITPCRKRADRADGRRRTSDHAARLLADRVDPAGYLVDRDNGRLEDGDSAAANEDERVRRTEIDRELVTPLKTPLSHRPSLNGTGASGERRHRPGIATARQVTLVR